MEVGLALRAGERFLDARVELVRALRPLAQRGEDAQCGRPARAPRGIGARRVRATAPAALRGAAGERFGQVGMEVHPRARSRAAGTARCRRRRGARPRQAARAQATATADIRAADVRDGHAGAPVVVAAWRLGATPSSERKRVRRIRGQRGAIATGIDDRGEYVAGFHRGQLVASPSRISRAPRALLRPACTSAAGRPSRPRRRRRRRMASG